MTYVGLALMFLGLFAIYNMYRCVASCSDILFVAIEEVFFNCSRVGE